jgi:hypothetical protein
LGHLAHRALEVCNQATFWASHDLDQFPALGAPVIQDLSGVMDD